MTINPEPIFEAILLYGVGIYLAINGLVWYWVINPKPQSEDQDVTVNAWK